MRNSIACVTCRSAKRQCIHSNRPPCERCKATGRAETCYFPAPGTSALHRQPKLLRRQSQSNSNRFEDGVTSVASDVAQLLRPPPPPDFTLHKVRPFDLLDDEVKNSYLRCSYKWSFHHIPGLLLKIRNKTLEPWLVWALLALAIRFSNQAPSPYQTTIDASNAYAAHARDLLQPNLEAPSIDRIQALLMIVGHSWGAGEGRRAWIYLGMAVRMMEVMGLCDESSYPRHRPLTREEFVAAEERRRTAWTCFLMDSLLSGGKGRKRSLAAPDMHIQLPCERDRFAFGEPVRCERLDGNLSADYPALPIGELGIIAHSMRVADIWGAVARWACSTVVTSELPWEPHSQFQQLTRLLEDWRRSLPERLQYNLFSLQAHTATDQGQAYCYMHAIYFMSAMFLHRAYLPVLGPGKEQQTHPSLDSKQLLKWEHWRRYSRYELFKISAEVSDMLDEMRTFGVYFLRGCVPWIGFTIYTAVGVMLYCFNFSSGEDDPEVVERARDRAIKGCTFLKEMQGQWPMASTWFETIKRMQAFYKNVKNKGDEAVTPDERERLQNAMVDYGALQPDPVQQPSSEHSSDTEANYKATPSNDSSISPAAAPAAADRSISPPDPQPQAQKQTQDYQQQQQQQTFNDGLINSDADGDGGVVPLDPLPEEIEEVEMFDYDWNINDAELEAMIANATEDFWAAFPGEVGRY